MIRLFVSDIDGCLSEPYKPHDLQAIAAIADLAARGSADPAGSGGIPAFTLCTGRPYAYTEAVSQVFGVRKPLLFEAGAGLFEPSAARIHWHASLDDSIAGQLAEVRRYLRTLVKGSTMMVDIGKASQAGIIGPEREQVMEFLPRVSRFVETNFPDLTVSHTDVSIDVMSGNVTKKEGLSWLSEVTGIPLAEMAYIGDTGGDIGALASVGRSFAPANANPEVRTAVQTVTSEPVARGVLSAIRQCIEENQ